MTQSLSIIFAGTPEFAAVTLDALIHSKHTIKAVYTQPDRPAGRGRQLTPSAVKKLALEHTIPIYQPVTLRHEQEQQQLAALNADVMIVAAYGLLLPAAILRTPPLGCINVHASLLPRWRGAAPIHRAILAGDTQTGISIMQMAQGLDTGDVLYEAACPILSTDTSQTLHDRLALLGADSLLYTLDHLATLQPKAQNNADATYAHKITKEEANINWQLSAIELERKIRAFNPWPVAFTTYDSITMRIWQATALSEISTQSAGTVIRRSPQGIDVATGKGILRLEQIQLPGGRTLPVAAVLNARQDDFVVGTVFR